MLETKPRVRVKARSRPHLVVVEYPKPEADADIMHVLEQFDESARSGRLVGIAVAGINRDGSMSTAYVQGPTLLSLMGATHHLLRRVSSGFGVA
jgi:hypothetical protein